MRAISTGIVRWGGLALLVSLGHLTVLWLWEPRCREIAPVMRKIARSNAEVDEKAINPPKDVLAVFAGDTAPTDKARPFIKQFGYEYPFSATIDLLRDADLTVVNLEAAVTKREEKFPLYKYYYYKVDPQALAAMKWAGIDAVSLANNHIMDYDTAGILDTLGFLDKAKIAHFGAGSNVTEARRGIIFELPGVRLGLLSYLEDSLFDSLYMRTFALSNKPGCARLTPLAIQQDLRRMKKYADLIVVMVHWGRNYSGITFFQKRYGRYLIEKGADVVIGHHPHIHQPVGMFRGKPIIYSLGNYAFGTAGREWFRYGLLARLHLINRRLKRIDLIPLLVQNRIVHYKPERLLPADAQKMLRDLAKQSAKLGARIEVQGAMGVIRL